MESLLNPTDGYGCQYVESDHCGHNVSNINHRMNQKYAMSLMDMIDFFVLR